jgi:predicted DNA-binding protein (MmcQ/YjbR family)
MAKRNPLRRVQSSLRKFALAYPEAYEDTPWGNPVIKVRGKIFVSLNLPDGGLEVWVKLPVSSRLALTLPFASPAGYGLGKSGWVSARFAAGDDVPVDLLQQWIDESYRAVAPKQLVKKLDEGDGALNP